LIARYGCLGKVPTPFPLIRQWLGIYQQKLHRSG